MNHRVLAPIGVVGLVLAVGSTAPVRVSAQAKQAAAPATTWVAARTTDGQPDLQGCWTNTSYVPLERPKAVNKEYLTKEEVADFIKRAAAAESEQTEPGTIPDVHYDFTQFGLDRSQSKLALNL